jgi:DNA polymerase III subunit chi
MTRIDFHFNIPDPLSHACRLARKIHRGQHKALFYHPDAGQLAKFDEALWTFSAHDFIPHVMADDPIAPLTPIWLTTQACDGPDSSLIINLGAQAPDFFSRFDRLIDVVGADEQARQAGRIRFRFYKDRGYPIEAHDMGSKTAGAPA